MEIELWRYRGGELGTLGILMLRGHTWECLCFMCEDQYRLTKVKGESRIPEGRYQIKLRTDSPMSDRYEKRYGDTHQGMLWLQNVPGFAFVYMHIGNDEDDTDGCLLFGERRSENLIRVLNSRDAYERLYPRFVAAIAGDGLWITIKDMDQPVLPRP